MKPRFLIGNTLIGGGKVISNLINTFGIKAEYCGNNMENIRNEIIKNKYDGLVFYMRGYDENTFNILKSILNDAPQLKIYAILMIDSDIIKEKLRTIGVKKYFDVSNPPIEICRSIAADNNYGDEKLFIPEIISYLYNKKFPFDLIGFKYLAVGIKICIDDPSMTNSKMKTTKIYPEIAKACLTSPTAVERGLRKIAHIAISKNISFDGTAKIKKLTAGNMVIAATEEYRRLKTSGKSDDYNIDFQNSNR